MAQPIKPDIREILLAEVKAHEPTSAIGEQLNQVTVLNAAARRLGITASRPDLEQALLTQWGELFRTRILAWGLNLSSPNAPFFHLTERGRQALTHLTRDPSNPAGYLRHLNSIARIDPVARSYVTEGLDCYVGGHYKAAAVMVGAAAESVILNLRDATIQRLGSLRQSVPKAMNDWMVKTMSDTLHNFLDGHKAKFGHALRDEFEAYWSAFRQQIRATRNDAGHPTSIDPVTSDAVHASLLIFPELAKLANSLQDWIAKNLN